MYLKESLTRSSTVIFLQTKECQKRSEFHLVGLEKMKRLRRRQYDPVIIKRTIGLVFGLSTALYTLFLSRCNLTNKAVRTI